MRKVVLFGPSVGRNAVSRTIENWLPSIARWNVSATIRAPTRVQLALVELRLAEDVEPERRVVEQRVSLSRVQRGEARRRRCRSWICAFVSLFTATPLLLAGTSPSAAPSRASPCSRAAGCGTRDCSPARDRRRAAIASGLTSFVSIRIALLNLAAGTTSAGLHRRELAEVVEPAEVRDPDARDRAGQAAAQVRELEQLRERRAREDLVPAVGRPHHAVPEPERGDRELDRHRRDARRRGADLEHLAALGEDVRDDRRMCRSSAGSRAGSSTGSAW